MKVSLKLRWLLVVASLAFLSSPWFVMGADLEFVTIRKGEPGRSVMYTGITRLKNGTLLCTYWDNKIDVKGEYGNKVKGSPWMIPGTKVMCVRSTDNGRTWSKTPTFIYQDKDSFSGAGSGHQAADGTVILPMGSYNAPAALEGGDALSQHWGFFGRSKDNGYTWEFERLSSEPFFEVAGYGGIIHLDDGTLWICQYACAGYQRTLAKAREMSEKGQKRGRRYCRLLESVDDGKTWSHYAYIGCDPTRPKETAHFPRRFDEPAIVQLPSGKILMMTRPYMQKGVSLDRGRTWEIGPSTLTRKGTSGLCPAMRYTKAGPPTGTIVLVYHDRWAEHAKRGGDYVSFSHDEGETWGYPVFVDGGAYPCLYELKKDSGNFLCGYYLHKSLIKCAFFSVPFPTGLRAISGLENSEQSGITVKWDEYKGQDCEKYEYRLYRSTQPEFELMSSTLVCSGKDICSYADEAVEKEQKYYYRIAALKDGKVVNKSWHASTVPGVTKLPSPEEVALIKGNIAPNPSFEMFGGKENDGNPDSISDYTVGQRPGSDLRLYVVSGGKCGEHCLKLDNSNGTGAGYLYFVFSNKDTSKFYRQTAFIRSDQTGQTYFGTETKLSKDWQKVVILDKFQHGSKHPWVYINVAPKQVIYVDGVEFRELK